MKSNKFIKDCGPYEVHSTSQGRGGVRLEIYPAYPKYNITPKRQAEKDIDPSWAKDPGWAVHREKGEGGGPSIFTAMALASEFEKFLNQSYTKREVSNWKKTLDRALRKFRAAANKRFEKAMAKLEKIKEENSRKR